VIETIKYILNDKNYKILKSVRFSNDKKISSSSCYKENINKNCEICSDFSLNEFKNMKFININFSENWTCDDLIKKFFDEIKINNNNNINFDVEIGNDVIYMKNNDLDEDEIEVFNNNLKKKLVNFEKFKGKKKVEIKIILNEKEIYNIHLINDNFKENNNNNNNEIENKELLNKKRNREEK
jgi:hypothetical protein